MKKRSSLMLLFLLFPAALLAQDGYELTDLTFRGNETLSDGDLLDRMQMFTVSWFSHTFLFKDRFEFSAEILASDLEELTRFYQSQGFLSVKLLRPEVKSFREEKEVEVTITIEEGPPVTIAEKPRFRFIAASHDSARVEEIALDSTSVLQLRPGERFHDAALVADQSRLITRYTEQGFPYVKADYTLNVDTVQNTVIIDWSIDAGPQCSFGDVNVTGAEKIPPDAVINNLQFYKGQVFSPRAIDESQQEVFALGAFRSVSFQAALSDRRSSVIPINIDVREAPGFKSKFGLGIGTETGFRASANVDFLALFGTTRSLNVKAKHSKLEPYNFTLTYTNPDFPTTRSNFILSPFFRREKEKSFDVRRFGSSASVQHRLSPFTNGFVTYAFERVDVYESVFDSAQFIAGINLMAYNKSSISTGATYDDSAPLFKPNSGVYIALAFQLSGLGLNSPFHFMKSSFEVRRYQRVSEPLVFATRWKIGFANTYTGIRFIPVEERYFSGGSNSVRGWSRQRLGPVDESDKPLGGRSLMELNNELRFPLIGVVSGVVFSDIGNVWTSAYTLRWGDLRTSFGAGIRIDSPVGPIRFDVARPFFDPEKRVQFHLDVGQAF
ncbi:MAG: BamA/TamA family outer membrane protein [Ignavibacteriae bacterium]|nr:BamA/TamA family outer membrane protein [Ignavibacteriota bacterium]